MVITLAYLNSRICLGVSSLIAFLISLKALFPLNLGPKTGKFGKASSVMYRSILV